MPNYTFEQTTSAASGQLDRTVVAMGNRDEWVKRVREVLEDAQQQRKELDVERDQTVDSFATRQAAIDEVISMCTAALGQVEQPHPAEAPDYAKKLHG